MSNPDHTFKFQAAIDLVKEKIESGEWPPGHKLPSQAQWLAQYGYNYGTLRQSYLVLKALGYIVGLQGQGVYVAERKKSKK